MSDENEAETTEEVEAETQTEEAEGLQDGDFVRLAYTARTVEGDQLVDTTDEDVAEEEGVDAQEQDIEPRTIVLGSGHLFESVESDIEGKEEGDTGSVVVPAGEAFGEYDADQVKTVSADKIPEDSRYPGAHVDVDGQHGHVETIIGGRARVDFNHPLAGEDVEYDYEILEVIEDREAQAAGLINATLGVDLDVWFQTDEVEETVEDEDGEEVTESVEKETLYIESDPQLAMNQQWMFGKQQIAQQLIDRLDVDRVIVQETIEGMGGLGGMMGGMGGATPDIEEALEDADVDVDEIAEELDADADE